MTTTSTTMIPTPVPMPDAFTCPYSRQCWQREFIRWMLVIVTAASTSWLAGCALKIRGPGIDLSLSTSWPKPAAFVATMSDTPLPPIIVNVTAASQPSSTNQHQEGKP